MTIPPLDPWMVFQLAVNAVILILGIAVGFVAAKVRARAWQGALLVAFGLVAGAGFAYLLLLSLVFNIEIRISTNFQADVVGMEIAASCS